MRAKTSFRNVILLILGLNFCNCFASSAVSNVWAETYYVQVRSTRLRSDPKLWAPSLAELKYGQKLEGFGDTRSGQAGWVRVKNSAGTIGFVHDSALTPREVLVSGSTKVSSKQIESSDIVVAGKGFNAQVENEYAQSDTKLNFQEVNRMEKLKVNDKELLAFMSSGKLLP